MKLVLLIVSAWIIVPVLVSCARYTSPAYSWSNAPRHSSGQAPDPKVHREAVVQIYNARAFSWRGIFATHPWIVVKRTDAGTYKRYEVVGWGSGSKLRTATTPPSMACGTDRHRRCCSMCAGLRRTR